MDWIYAWLGFSFVFAVFMVIAAIIRGEFK